MHKNIIPHRKKPNKTKQDLLYVHLSAILLSTSCVFPKLIDMPAISIVLGRSLLSIPLFIGILFLNKHHIKAPKKSDLPRIIITGILFGLNLVLFYQSIQLSSIAIGMITLFSYPLITAILSPIIEKKTIKPMQIILSLSIIIGVSSIVYENLISNQCLLGIIVGLGASLAFSWRNIFIKPLTKTYSNNNLSTFTFQVHRQNRSLEKNPTRHLKIVQRPEIYHQNLGADE